MGQKYSHLSQHDRNVIERMVLARCSKKTIANHLGIHISTVYRELSRNKTIHPRTKESYYTGGFAQRYYLKRRRKSTKLSQNNPLRSFVNDKLKQRWSPWQIEWYLKKHDNPVGNVTHETIYRYIYSHWQRQYEFFPYLRRQHMSRISPHSKKPRIHPSLTIHARAATVNTREIFGHWECDLMVFKKGIKTNLITLVERKTRFTLALKNADRRALPTAMAIIRRLSSIKAHVHFITFDQGVEFAGFAAIKTCLEADIFFCDPSSPHQKGSIENRNGVIRTVYARDCDIMSVKQAQIDETLKSINERPMVCLNYHSPEHMFYTHLNDT
jgi:IS30 family transposase